MAIDEALLRAGRVATLRIYAWAPAGLSMGYFQPCAPFERVEGEHVLVRRPTGGGAIYHDREITFALTADATLLPWGIRATYELLHEACARALLEVGVSARIAEPGTHPPPGRRTAPLWCFDRPAAGDVVDPDGRKLVGSAQRRVKRPRPRVLHHGSIPLVRPRPAPFGGDVASQTDPDVVRAPLREALVREIAAALGATPRAGDLEPDELELSARLEERRYADASFLRRR